MKMYIDIKEANLIYLLEEHEYIEGCLDELVFVQILVQRNNLFSDKERKETIINAEKEFVKEMTELKFIETENGTLCNTDDISQFIDGVHRMIFLVSYLWAEGKVIGGGFASIQEIHNRNVQWMTKFCKQHIQDKKWFDELQFEHRTPRTIHCLE